jgi:3-oxoacyl-(acyl-carrier-protein) synthase
LNLLFVLFFSDSVDRVSLFALAATMDAFHTAGISDPSELFEHVHVSEVGNSVGGGMGGMSSLRGIFRERMVEASGLSSDMLQESFINTTAAWINMLLVSSCGPVKTPVVRQQKTCMYNQQQLIYFYFIIDIMCFNCLFI